MASTEAQKQWYVRNRERLRERNRTYYEAHREEISAQQAAYRAERKQEIAEYDASYYAANCEAIKARVRERYEARTPEQVEADRVAWNERYRGNPKTNASRRKSQRGVRMEVLIGYGGACACCGADYLPHLTLDHVDGSGAEDRRKRDSRSLYYQLRRLLREGSVDPNFQVLCWNCNIAKHHLGECSCQEVRSVGGDS